MARKPRHSADVAFGRLMMMVLFIAEGAVFLVLLLYVAPRTNGFLQFLVANGVGFSGAAALFFLLYLLPTRPIGAYRQREGHYLIIRPRFINFLGTILLFYTSILLPIVAVFTAIGIADALWEEPSAIFPILKSIDPWSAYQSFDNGKGILFVLAPGLLALPWLYPKFLRHAARAARFTFGRVGIQVGTDGLSVLGPSPALIPWSSIRAADVVVHGYTEKVVLRGGPELDALRPKIDARIPHELRKDIEWKEQGVPLGLDFLRVRADELAELMRSYL